MRSSARTLGGALAGWSPHHEVAVRFADHKTIVHAEVGELDLDCQALFTEDQTQALLVLTAAPGSPAEDKLRLLAVLGTQSFVNTSGCPSV